jgi:TonB family protein
MKIFIPICLLLFSTTYLFAQQKQVISRDTINIHGFIYDNSGKGVNFMHIQSTQLETEHNTFKVAAYTNDRGYFELKGAKFNDTLTIGPDIHYNLSPYYNMGSRFLAIYLPPAKVLNITPTTPFVISQKRKYPRAKPSFTVTSAENKPVDNIVNIAAQYPGGITELEAFIKQNLQYPESAVKANLEGMVEVNFTITKEGNHKDFKILRGISDDCDDEVLRVLKKSPNWQPALDHNQPVSMQQSISIQFKLTD